MSRYASLLLLAALVGCHTERIVETALVCPCVRFELAAINQNPMPYTPPSGFVVENPNALLADVLMFEDDGKVTETSSVRTVLNGDTTVKVTDVVGRYQTSIPLVNVAWPDAGNFTYTLRNDTLSVGVSRNYVVGTKTYPIRETWTYIRTL